MIRTQLDGAVAVLTGAGSGIGRAIASVLALLALVTLAAKTALEWRFSDELSAGRRH